MQLERRDVGTAQSLRSAILKSEQNNPGFCYDLVASIMRRADLNVNLNEAVLRLQGNITEADREYHQSSIINGIYIGQWLFQIPHNDLFTVEWPTYI